MAPELKGVFYPEEEMLRTRSLADVAKAMVESLHALVEDESAALSVRPTVAVFTSEPWV